MFILIQKIIDKYSQDINIINFEKNNAGQIHLSEKNKTRLLPSNQADFNIITNNKLDDFHFESTKMSVSDIGVCIY